MKRINVRQDGFTLAELMIAVAVIGVLAAIAYPSYMAYVERSHRAQLKTIMLENAQILERFFTEANAYDVNATGGTPAISTRSPKLNEGPLVYGINIVSNATTFTMTATPEAGGVMDGDDCGNFTLNQLGQRGLTNNTRSIAECWGR